MNQSYVSIRKILTVIAIFSGTLLPACASSRTTVIDQALPTPSQVTISTRLPEITLPSPTPTPSITPAPLPSNTPVRLVPAFDHIVMILLENKEISTVIGNPQMRNFNRLAKENTLLTQHYAIMHPSLPNYLALVGGDTFQITQNCEDCFIDARSLADEIEESGRTWKTYQEHMPEPCFIGSTLRYVQKHNPFIYFNAIRLDQARCQRSIVPLTELETDLNNNTLPNFVFITPDLCHSAHDCDLKTVDEWLTPWVERLQSYPPLAKNGLIILTWDEGQGQHTCCELSEGGGRVATILISPNAKKGFQDETQYTHYSILKTILQAWDLPEIGHSADPQTNLITAPWQQP
jgi:hypothetical protein